MVQPVGSGMWHLMVHSYLRPPAAERLWVGHLATLYRTCKTGEYLLYWALGPIGWDNASGILSKKGMPIITDILHRSRNVHFCSRVFAECQAHTVHCLRSWAASTTQPPKALCSWSLVRELDSRCVNQ